MLDIIHELYAIRINDSIPDSLVQEFKHDIHYDELIKTRKHDVWNQPNHKLPSSLKLFKHINGILKPYDLGIENLDFFIWSRLNKENFTIHIDALHNPYTQELESVNARVNFPIQGTGAIMEWYSPDDIVTTMIRDNSSSYYEFDKKNESVMPAYSLPASTPLIVNASIPHTINLGDSAVDRFTISGRIRKNILFSEVIRRVTENV